MSCVLSRLKLGLLNLNFSGSHLNPLQAPVLGRVPVVGNLCHNTPDNWCVQNFNENSLLPVVAIVAHLNQNVYKMDIDFDKVLLKSFHRRLEPFEVGIL